MGDKSATLASADKAPDRLADRQLSQKTPNPIFSLQQSIGNQAMLRLLEAGAIQPKLRVSQAGDPDEIEADRVAERVVSARPAPVIQRKCGCSGGASCVKCAEEEGAIHRSVAGTIHRQSQPSRQPQAPAADEAPGIVQDVLQSPGKSLDPSTRSYFEPRFGQDFSTVRVHTGDHAAESARAVNALAYTVGPHIVFGQGQFSPEAPHSRRLIAHELAHVVQQQAAGPGVLHRAPPTHQDDHAFQEYQGPQPHGNPLTQPLSWDELFHKVVSDQRAFLFTTPDEASNPAVDPGGVGRGVGPDRSHHGSEVIAAIEILDHNGNRVAIGFGAHRLLPGGHGEEQAMAGLEHELAGRDVRGGKMWAVVDQFPCGPDRHDCGLQLRQFARDHGLELEVRVPMREHATQSGRNVSPRTASRGAYRTDLDADPRTQVHLEVVDHQPGPSRPGGTGGTPPTQGGGTPPAHGGADESTHGAGTTPAHGDTGADHTTTHPSGSGGTKPSVGTDSESRAGGGGAGHFSGVAIHIGTGLASLGLGYLIGKLKARQDEKTANKQIEAFKEIARQKINANPDGALTQMMRNPDAPVYAWVHLKKAVITSIGVDSEAIEPPTTDSSPMFDLGPIDYLSTPVDASLITSFPVAIVGGHSYTIIHDVVVDLPIPTPPLVDLITFAKSRNLPMDDLRKYAMDRYQSSISSLQSSLDASTGITAAHQGVRDAIQKLNAQFEIARKLKDVALQQSIAKSLTSAAASLSAFRDREKTASESIEQSNQKMQYWANIVALINQPLAAGATTQPAAPPPPLHPPSDAAAHTHQSTTLPPPRTTLPSQPCPDCHSTSHLQQPSSLLNLPDPTPEELLKMYEAVKGK
jgi:hypothetical protein